MYLVVQLQGLIAGYLPVRRVIPFDGLERPEDGEEEGDLGHGRLRM